MINVGTLAKIRRMHLRDGLPIKEIERRTGLARNTIKAWLRKGEMVEPKYPQRVNQTKLDGYTETLATWLKAYLHRIGRTGRAGKLGVAVTFVDWEDMARWVHINRELELNIPEPMETYSNSPHLFEDLGIAAGTRKKSIGLFPLLSWQSFWPKRLWIRARYQNIAVALQFFAVTAINELVLCSGFCL